MPEVMNLTEYRALLVALESSAGKLQASRRAQSLKDQNTASVDHPEHKLGCFVERVFKDEMVVKGLMPLKETTGRRFRVDVAIERLKLCFELDGYSHHGLSKKGFTKDRERDRLLMLAGWRVFRFTAKQVNQDGYGVMEILKEIREAALVWAS